MFDSFRKNFELGNKKWKEYTGFFERKEIPAKMILLREGEISKRVFVVEKGCLRAWFNNDGKDVTFQFFFENSIVASIESFRKNVPSLISIESIEPCIIWTAEKKNIEKIISEIRKYPALHELFIDRIFERTYNYMKHHLSFIRDTPEQRYLNLLKEKPQITQRIPQHYIASYLGITKVHLSRIKSKLAREK